MTLQQKIDWVYDFFDGKEELLRFAFGIYGENDETLDNICYWFAAMTFEQVYEDYALV